MVRVLVVFVEWFVLVVKLSSCSSSSLSERQMVLSRLALGLFLFSALLRSFSSVLFQQQILAHSSDNRLVIFVSILSRPMITSLLFSDLLPQMVVEAGG